jgi:RNA polymerase sigma-70 factor, ECF subfamily
MATELAGGAGGSQVDDTFDSRAFELLYGEHSATVYRIALRVLGNAAQAQDVVQDVFLRLWRHPGSFDAERGSLVNYVRLMARSRALDIWREAQVAGRARERMKVLALADEGRADERPAVAAELRRDRAIVLRQLSRLPVAQRSAIVLAYWGGLTCEEIAARLEVPVGTIKSRLRLGMMKLRERCEPQLGFAPELPLAA